MRLTLAEYIAEKKSLFWLVIVILTLLRINWLCITQLELYGDEAQYWLWSQSLDFGYYSKPPVIAFLISATTWLLGDSEAAIRISSPIIHLCVAFVIYRISTLFIADKLAALWCAFAYITLPSVFLSSSLISTDPAFMLFWALSFFFYLKATKNDKLRDWIMLGICAGLGLLTKYSMAIFALSVFCHLLYRQSVKHTFTNYKFWLATFISFCLFSLNLYWNYENDFPNFSHTYDLAQGPADQHFSLKNPFMFFIGQIGMIGPILFVAFILSIKRGGKALNCFALPFLISILLLSFYSRAHANWAAPAYVAATIMAVHYLFRTSRIFWLKFSTILHLGIGVFMMCYIAIIENFDITLNKYTDPLRRIKGNMDMTEQLTSFIEEDGYCILAFDDRMTLSAFAYNLRGHSCKIAKWNPSGNIGDHFDLTTDMNDYQGENIYFISKDADEEELQKYSRKIHYVTELTYNPYYGFSKSLHVYKLKDFKGY